MKAMVLRGTSLAIEEIARPVPGPGQVLGRVLACGICGSDLHAAKHMDQMVAATRLSPAGVAVTDAAPGIVMGHEYVCEIVESGEGVEGWEPGARVTSLPVLLDASSPSGVTAIGYSAVNPGAYGEYIVMSAPLLLRVADHVSDAIAATTEPCAVGLHAVRMAKLGGTENVLVMGAGPIGLMTLLWLKRLGSHKVIVSDPSPERRGLAQKLGADGVYDPTAIDLAAAMASEFAPPERDGTPSYGRPATKAAPDVVFECVGVPGTLHTAMTLVQTRGTVIVVGVCMQPDTITPLLGINKQLALQFVLGYTGPEYAEALAAITDGSVDTSSLVTRTVTLEELPATFTALADPTDCKVVMVGAGK